MIAVVRAAETFKRMVSAIFRKYDLSFPQDIILREREVVLPKNRRYHSFKSLCGPHHRYHNIFIKVWVASIGHLFHILISKGTCFNIIKNTLYQFAVLQTRK